MGILTDYMKGLPPEVLQRVQTSGGAEVFIPGERASIMRMDNSGWQNPDGPAYRGYEWEPGMFKDNTQLNGRPYADFDDQGNFLGTGTFEGIGGGGILNSPWLPFLLAAGPFAMSIMGAGGAAAAGAGASGAGAGAGGAGIGTTFGVVDGSVLSGAAGMGGAQGLTLGGSGLGLTAAPGSGLSLAAPAGGSLGGGLGLVAPGSALYEAGALASGTGTLLGDAALQGTYTMADGTILQTGGAGGGGIPRVPGGGGIPGGGGPTDLLKLLGGILPGLAGLQGAKDSENSADKAFELANEMIQRSDPFYRYREHAGQRMVDRQLQLENYSVDPGDVTQIPGYQAGLEAVQRAGAAQGFTGSGNMVKALQDYGGNFWNAERQFRVGERTALQGERDKLAGYAGGNVAPGAGFGPAAQLFGSGLASEAYGNQAQINGIGQILSALGGGGNPSTGSFFDLFRNFGSSLGGGGANPSDVMTQLGGYALA